MVQFTKLRLTGFKSFVDATDLAIQPGLTGIVGPNGCGKSNLVEALRWVMGETSAKRLRGGEMDDVIFGGTGQRPARNIAEVSLLLDNSDRKATAQFNDSDIVEISRRIDRGEGSTYRVNGRDTRAKDVQLLFADVSAGAHSTALVSQGRVGAIVNAKPIDRRALLEEAAGITGLHSRRHEAELRLKAAETNLARLDDVILTLESQLAALKKQARQAARYRNLQDHIRRAEAALFHLLWLDAKARLVQAEAVLDSAAAEVARRTETAAMASRRQAEIAAELPALRQAEAERAAEWQRLALAQGALDKEEERLQRETADAQRQLTENEADAARAAALAADAGAARQRLAGEAAELQKIAAAEAELAESAAAEVRSRQENLEAGESEVANLTQELAAAVAMRRAIERRLEEAESRRARLATRESEIANLRERHIAAMTDDAEIAALRDALVAAEAELAAAQAAESEIGSARGIAAEGEKRARDILHAAETRMQRLKGEFAALSAIFAASDTDMWPPLIDALNVEPGYELALAIALGEDLQASTDLGAPLHWRAGESAGIGTAGPALPPGARPLGDFVTGSEVLTRRLAQIGLVESEAECRALGGTLTQGQRLVSKDGAMWRWDGFTIAAGAASPAATRLQQRNRLKELTGEMTLATSARDAAAADLATAAQEAGSAAGRETEARQRLAAAYDRARYCRERVQQAEAKAAEMNSRRAGFDQQLAELAVQIADMTEQSRLATSEMANLPDLATRENALAMRRSLLAEERSALIEARSAHDRLAREAELRRQRLAAIAAEEKSWAERGAMAERHAGELAQRRDLIAAEIARLAALPAELAKKRSELLDLIAAAERARQEAADTLLRAEQALAEADRTAKMAEGELAEARESRIRAEAQIAQAEEASAHLAERIREKLDCAPEAVFELAELDPGEDLPERDAVEQRVARLTRERDTMGPVNLRAEAEAEELDRQLTGMQTERSDLIAAIARLRQGISSLNREGRERLLAAFELVNGHFASLFARLFGGGKAHLQLTEAEDPLDAGLEIFASPPGKKLQILSLLSGGEQALTALALLFAVFMVNPAPICVLDEVDAPLDDANVERFCNLVDDLARETGTRFLVITHHRLTMARMDRLFGVTMAERGVSQLVSVDLQEVERLKAAE